MNRAEKQALIETVNTKFKKANIALVVHNKGLTVAEMNQLRLKMREAGAEFKVSKNRLTKLAAKDTKFEQNGVNVVVDKKSALLLDGTTLGWYSSLERQGFTFDNPNAVKSCGCGKSFQ